MSRRCWLTVTPGVCGGDPCIRGTRMPLASLVSVGGGAFADAVLVQYPHLARAAVIGVLDDMQRMTTERLMKEDRDRRGPRCEGCGKPATMHDCDGVDLCRRCYGGLMRVDKAREKRRTMT